MMPRPPITAVLLDVGGTLWPDGWPWLPEDHQVRVERLLQAIPGLDAEAAPALIHDLDVSAASITEGLDQDLRRYVGEPLRRHGVEPTAERVRAVVEAMSLPARPLVGLLPGAPELLRAVRRAGLRSVVLSNSYWRSNAAYRRDFEDLGVGAEVDAYVSSLDVGFRKPHRAMFDAGLRAAGTAAERCAMVGNSEDKDVRPANALGLRTIRVAIEEPLPATTQADAVTTSLDEVAHLLTSWAAAR
ncbi:MAG TPA: HAD family hydrolase [Actinomycetota bacterium]|nr:HAD family hydrolase [Actinomycetota bacterium]